MNSSMNVLQKQFVLQNFITLDGLSYRVGWVKPRILIEDRKMMMITRARWRCAVLLKMAKFRSKGDVFHPVPVAADRSQPVRSVCRTPHAANKILLYRQWKKAGGESQKENLAPMRLFRKRRRRRWAVAICIC